MKNIFNRIFLCLSVAVMALSGCVKEGHGDFALSVKETGADYVDIFVTAPSNLEVAYVVSTERQLVTPAVLFATGTVVNVSPAQVLRIDTDIVQDTHYYLYAVAKLNETDFSAKMILEFTTKNYGFEETVTIVKTDYDGFKVHVNVPESVQKRGNVLRYGYLNVAMYNKTTDMYGTTDVERLITNGNIYGRYIKNDSTLVYDPTNLYEYTESGEELDFHDDIMPGEPGIFMVGEFGWASSSEEIEDKIGISGWDPAYIIPMYDFSTDEWTGEFARTDFYMTQPSELDAELEIEVYDITPLDAQIYFNPDDDIYQYIYMILDDNTYQAMVKLCGGEQHVQWFISSYLGYFEGSTMAQGPLEINAGSHFTEPLAKDTHYTIVANAWGDARGTSQKLFKADFTTKAATQPKPVIEVTAVNTGDPYYATFNIKAGKDKNGNVQPIAGAYYGVNYAREWQLMFNQKYTYETILKGNYSFTPDELAQINSEEGYNYTVYTLDGETTRMAVYGCNDEYTFNDVDPDDPDAVKGYADYVAPWASGNGPVSGYEALAEKLSGEWTASATLQAKTLIEGTTDEYETYEVKHKSRIVISDSAPELPAALPDSVYNLYDDKTKSEVDGMFEELGLLSEYFTEHRLESNSRLLCSGFVDFDYYEKVGRLDWRSPYDLFVASDYSSVDVAQLMYDFGPKWYLELQADGSVIVPFSSYYMPPMHNWTGTPYYVGGVGSDYAFYDSNESYPGFPVEISEDGNSMVVKPIVMEDGSAYYMNALGFNTQYAGELEMVAPIISEIVLTRGWTEPAKASSVVPASRRVKAAAIDGSPAEMPVVRQVRSMTRFTEPVKYKMAETVPVITEEELDAVMTREVKKYFNITDNE